MTAAPWSPSDPELVTLETAKAHLRITDALHDADVQQKLTAASASIRDFLKDRNDPEWDDASVPPFIAQAVLLLLGLLYENRGDEFKPGTEVWNAITTLCRHYVDPALA